MIRRPDVEVFFTDGVLRENISEDELWMLAALALQDMIPGQIEFVIFAPNITTHGEGSTLYRCINTIPRPVWAKVDDYGTPEVLSRELGYPTKARYTLTILLPEEY